jgi:antibiotic biosynthesis monooxygenase (ABM) superfamily enzyme
VPAGDEPVAVVTQTCVLPGRAPEFREWLDRVRHVLDGVGGSLDHSVIEPAPPLQPDWVVVQRFAGLDAARAWLESAERQRLLDEIEPALVGDLEVHLFTAGAGPESAAVSAVIATRVVPGREEAFLRWHRRIAAAQASFPGYRGYRLERPIPGVQEDWVAILRYDSEEHLAAWLASPERHALLHEGGAFAEAADIHTVRSGFDTWFAFDEAPPGAAAPAWKQNMLVLLVLYPLVFLFGEWVQTPLLVDNGVPFWLALFIGNAVSVALLGWVLIPGASRRLRWWLAPPAGEKGRRLTWVGAALVASLYAASLAVFSQFG